jgi:hypothetical protein
MSVMDITLLAGGCIVMVACDALVGAWDKLAMCAGGRSRMSQVLQYSLIMSCHSMWLFSAMDLG